MIYLNKLIFTLSIILIIMLGVLWGVINYTGNRKVGQEDIFEDDNEIMSIEEIPNLELIEASAAEDKTTPNTLVIYRTYYTKCKHYIQKYENIDASLVNLTEEEFREKNRKWDIDKFSAGEIELSREDENFCNEHYLLKLENMVIVVYKVDENGVETEYEQTGITTEYLTDEDILRLTTGIYVYGKENLSNTIEDYE